MDGRTAPPGRRIVDQGGGSRRVVEAGAGRLPLLPEVLRGRAARHGRRAALVFLADGEAEAARLDYAGLAAAVGGLAGRLAGAAAAGERALLVYPPGLDFAVAFLACLEAGVVAVPAYPPRRSREDGRGEGRLVRLAADVEPRLLLTTAALAPRLERALPPAARRGAETWATDRAAAPGPAWRPPALDPAAPAFLQYTSGTTGAPRGVVVTHGNLAACEEAIRRGFGQDEGSVVVGWLPPYHDMGLVGTLLQPLWCGGTGVLMAPAAFLARPRRWLEAVGRYGATTTGGPDFGWLHCVRRVPPAERRGLDLSSLAVAFSGAEPVRPATLDAFAEAFAPCGFRREAFFPCYGLAEATLFVSGGEPAAPPVVREVARPGEPPRRLAGCGRAWAGEALRVVDPERRVPLAAGEEGEIWVAGPAVAAGYWRRPAETAATFGARLADGSGPWLRTGDLGVLGADGELFVTGRAKELVIVRGRNVHPEDVEAVAAGAHPAVVAGGAAAFAVEVEGEERLAVVVEIARRREDEAAAAGEAVRAAVLADQEVAPWRVAAVRAGALPRTTSGKVRRGACREALLGGALPRLAEGGVGAVAAVGGAPPERPDEGSEPWARGGAGTDEAAVEGGAGASAREGRRAGAQGPAERGATVGEPRPAVAGSAETTASGRAVARTALGTPADAGAPAGGGDRMLRGESGARVAPARPALAGGAAESIAEVVARLAAAVAALAADLDRPLALDSLQAVELRERVAREAGVELPLEEVLAGATPRRLAGLALRAAEVPALAPVAAEPGSVHPAAAGQRALWLVERLTPGGAGLHLAFAAAVRLGGAAPAAGAVERAVAAVVGRHAALRTSLPAPGGEPVQRVAGGAPVDLAAAEAPGDEAALHELLAAAAAEAFDLERGPLVRVRLWRRPADAVLLFAVHHAVADFWSLEIVLAELAAELAAAAPGERVEPPAPRHGVAAGGRLARPASARRSDADDTGLLAFARWQERLLAGPAGRALEAWWRDELAGAPEALELPADRPRPAPPGRRGESVPVPLAPDAAAALAALAAAAGSTPFAVLLAAWQAVLARSAGAGEVVVGCAAAGRPAAALASAVGHFVNLLPLRGRIADDPPFAELAARAGRTLAGGLAHQDLPFPRIVEVAAARPDPARHPLVQAGLVLETPRRLPAAGLAPFVLGEAGGRLALGPLELSSLPLPRRGVQLDLLLTVVDAGGRLAAALDFAGDLFDRATAERLAGRLAAALAAAAAAPRERVSRLAMLSEAERRQALGFDTALPLPAPPSPVPEAFFARARRRPEAPAVLWRDGTGGGVEALSYGELAAWVSALAARLRAAGAGGESTVGVLLGREPARIAAVLAVLAAGGCAVAIEPDEPRERIGRLLRRAGVGLLITSGAAAEAAPDGPWRRIDPAAPADPRPDPATASPPLHPDAAAYVVFTSGSTGEPKGVVVPHRAIAALVAAAAGDVPAGPGARVLHLASLAFDIAMGEILLPLAAVGAVCLAAADDRRSGAALAAAVEAFGATTLIVTPSVLSLVPPDRELPTLVGLLVGGEPAPPAVAARWAGRRLFNGYGPAEATVYVSRRRCPPDRPEAMRDLGEAVPGSRVAHLGRWLEPVPPGAAGEVALAGAALARGYLGDPRATAERFVPDPWSPAPGGRLYRSGDLARRRPGGALEYLGRRDDGLKVRGVRIEPGEVEAALARHPAVARAAVAARGERLVAWWVPANGGPPPSPAELRAFLAASLPAPFVPSRLLPVPALPLTATGKVDRAALVEPPAAAPAAAAPRGEVERLVARLWCDELGVAAVDREATFFDLGGQSLAIARVHARLAEALGREVPIADLFSHPTVAALAAHLANGGAPADATAAASAAAGGRRRAGLAALRRARPPEAAGAGRPEPR